MSDQQQRSTAVDIDLDINNQNSNQGSSDNAHNAPIRNLDSLKPGHYRKGHATANANTDHSNDNNSSNSPGGSTSPQPATARDKSKTRRRVPVTMRRNRSGSLTIGVRRSYSSAVNEGSSGHANNSNNNSVSIDNYEGGGVEGTNTGSGGNPLSAGLALPLPRHQQQQQQQQRRSFSEMPYDRRSHGVNPMNLNNFAPRPSTVDVQGQQQPRRPSNTHGNSSGGNGGSFNCLYSLYPPSMTQHNGLSSSSNNNNNNNNVNTSGENDNSTGLPARSPPQLRFHGQRALSGNRRLPSSSSAYPHYPLNPLNGSNTAMTATLAFPATSVKAAAAMATPREREEEPAAAAVHGGSSSNSNAARATATATPSVSKWIRVKIYLDSGQGSSAGGGSTKPTRTVLSYMPTNVSFATFEQRINTRCKNSPFATSGGGGSSNNNSNNNNVNAESNSSVDMSSRPTSSPSAPSPPSSAVADARRIRIFYLHNNFLATAAAACQTSASSSSDVAQAIVGNNNNNNNNNGDGSGNNSNKGVRLHLADVEAHCLCIDRNTYPRFLQLYTAAHQQNDKGEMRVFVTLATNGSNSVHGKKHDVDYYFQDWAVQPLLDSQQTVRLSNSHLSPTITGENTTNQGNSDANTSNPRRPMPAMSPAPPPPGASGGRAGGGSSSSSGNANQHHASGPSRSSSIGMPLRRNQVSGSATNSSTNHEKRSASLHGNRSINSHLNHINDNSNTNNGSLDPYHRNFNNSDDDAVNTSPVRRATPPLQQQQQQQQQTRGRPRHVHLLPGEEEQHARHKHSNRRSGNMDGPHLEEGLSTVEILKNPAGGSRLRLPSRPAVTHHATGNNTNSGSSSSGHMRHRGQSHRSHSTHNSDREPWLQTLEALTRDVVPWTNVGLIGKGAFGTVYEGIIDGEVASSAISSLTLDHLLRQQGKEAGASSHNKDSHSDNSRKQEGRALRSTNGENAELASSMKRPLHVAVKVLDLNLNSFSVYSTNSSTSSNNNGESNNNAATAAMTSSNGSGNNNNHNGHSNHYTHGVNNPALSHVKKLLREINLMRRHRHPNIVSYVHCQIREREDERVRMHGYFPHYASGAAAGGEGAIVGRHFPRSNHNNHPNGYPAIIGGGGGSADPSSSSSSAAAGGGGAAAGQPASLPRFLQVEIIMELCTGGTLSDQVKHAKHGRLPVRVARAYIRDVLTGLAFLHARGVIHRDIKPDNVLIAADGTAKLADFGCSRRIADATTATFNSSPSVMSTLTHNNNNSSQFEHLDSILSRWDSVGTINTVAHTMVGTPLFMAPEVVQADIDEAFGGGTHGPPAVQTTAARLGSNGTGDTADNPDSGGGGSSNNSSGVGYAAPADIWAVGCLTLQLFGRTPWPLNASTTPFQIMLRIAQADPNSLPPGVPTGAPPTLRFFLAKCLQRDPRRRASARELLRTEWLTCSEEELVEMP